MAFSGIPAEAFEFYDALAADNTRAFWEDHRHEYESAVREPLTRLGAELEPRFGAPRMFRPYRDLRFSRDKRPIKDHQGMVVELRDGVAWYLQLSASGLMVAGGWYRGSPEQLARYREAVASQEGEELAQLIEQLEAFTIDGDVMKTRPKGIAADHPRVALLRHRTLYAWRSDEPAAWMGGPEVITRVTDSWERLTPLLDWLAGVVGPGEPATRR